MYELEESVMKDLETIDLTLRIICEPDDAARFALSSEAMRATCRAVADALMLNGRFHVAPSVIAWPERELAAGETAVDNL
jgi:hypothetical protein